MPLLIRTLLSLTSSIEIYFRDTTTPPRCSKQPFGSLPPARSARLTFCSVASRRLTSQLAWRTHAERRRPGDAGSRPRASTAPSAEPRPPEGLGPREPRKRRRPLPDERWRRGARGGFEHAGSTRERNAADDQRHVSDHRHRYMSIKLDAAAHVRIEAAVSLNLLSHYAIPDLNFRHHSQ